jgi:DNA-binding transcriptional MerR regulator
MTIGAFALASGLTIEALRHYHEVGVLVPAKVDQATGYRRYGLDQVRRAHAIRTLRRIHMPLQAVGEVLAAEDPELVRKLLKEHRARVKDRVSKLAVALAAVDRLVEKGAVMPTATGPRVIGMTVMGPDVEVLREFYENVLGIAFEGEDHGYGMHYHATGGSFSYPDGFFLFTLWAYSEDWPRLRSGVEMIVNGVDQTFERAIAAGGKAVQPPFDSEAFPRSAIFEDPAGNRVQIYEAE